MKIKKLEIHGFKSFVDKTTLAFPKGVTSIVGPNGCGKSNIVDAIRWVLGEQNARHLRGKLMEDIIFNGSESRKPIGIAEAVLTLSNEEGVAPAAYVNFTEIEIARRLFRSGESEYYINKVQCRLKDIVDLFTDTGIGTRAYSIIEQGQVGWLVNAKPEERRGLFEEAAGINKFKHRKDAALRRLEATKQNLTRVNDIIGEVKRQMNSLNRQAKKAERYKAMREELKGFELFLASEEYKALHEKKHEGENKLEMLKEKEVELSTAMSQKASSLEDVRAKYLKQEAALKTAKQKAFEADSQIKDREKEIQLSELRIGELKRNEERLLKEIEELKVQQDTVEKEIEWLNGLLSEINVAVESEESRLLNEENSLKDVERKSQESEVRSQELRKKKDEIGNKVVQIKNNIAVYLKDEERLNLITGKALREKEELEKRSRESAVRSHELRSRKEEIENGKRNVEKTQELASEQLQDLEGRLIQKDNELKTLKQDFSRTSSRLHTLKELEKNLEGFKDGVKAIMLNKKEDHAEYKHIHGLVADVIETSAQYEKAVEAVLGERLQYVIVESHDAGVQAVEYLKTQAKGRGSFVPLKGARIKNNGEKPGHAHPNTEELLEHVRIKDGYYPIAQYLLGDVLLVHNLNDAIELWRSNGLDKTFVTLEGEMVDNQGVITGGYSNGADGNILRKRREIKDLSAALSDLERKIAETYNGIKSLKYNIDTNQRNLDGLKKDSHSKEIELINIEAELKREEGEFGRLNQQIATLVTEVSDIERGQKEVSSKKAQLLKDMESVEREQKEIETTVHTVTDEVSALQKKKEELSSVVTDIKVKLASSNERLEGIKGQIDDKKRFLAEISNRIDEKQAEIENGKLEIAGHELKAAEIKGGLEEALKTMDVDRRQEIRQEEQLNQTMTDANQLEEALSEIKKDIAQLQEGINSVNLDLKEIELNLAHLAERMAERYRVAIESYNPTEEIKTLDRGVITERMNELKTKIT